MRGAGRVSRGAIGAVLMAALLLAAPLAAQDGQRLQSPVLTIDSDALFDQTAYGRRIAADIAADSAALEAENRRIEAALEAEERTLTNTRNTLDPASFRQLAADFDAKVTRVRTEQGAKARALQTRSDQARRQFLGSIAPVLDAIMQDTGAAVILEQRSVFFAARVIDITALAIARMDAAIGDGRTIELPQ